MSVRSGQSITVEFITSNPTTQAATDADSTPSGTLVVNGTDDAASVTVTHIDTGRYKAAVTLPTLAIGDVVELVIAATVSTIAGKAVVWRDTKDVLLDSSGDVTFNNTAIGTVTDLTNLPAIPNNWLTAAGIAAGALNGKGDWLTTLGSTAPTGWIDAGAIAANAIGASELAADAVAEIAAGVWDLAMSGHTTAGTFGAAVSASAPSAATIAAAVWDEVNTGATHNVNNSTGKQLRTISGNTDAIYSGTCPSQAGMTATQIKLDAGASSTNNIYRYDVISIISGTNAGDSRIITGYTGSSKVATVDADWTTQPDATSVFEITPTARAQVVSYVTGQDPATLVWGAAVRTLTAMPTIPTNWITADGLASDAVAEIQAGLSTYAGGDTSGVTTLLSRLTAGRATNLDRLDATISSRSTYAGEDTAGTSTLLARLTATRASRLDNLDVAISTLPDAAANADKLIGRNIAGGSDGGRTIAEAMAFLRNKWVITAGTLTVYETNDSSVSWTSTVTTTASNPITGSDPA